MVHDGWPNCLYDCYVRLNLDVLLLAKYSDLLGGGERSLKNFYEQVQRVTGDIVPFNVFATVNNRFSFEPAGAEVHATLEQEFLNDSIRNKLARARKLEHDGLPMIVFARFAALIMLKLLLGTPRRNGELRETALGACALHANDYTESVDASDLRHGLLPVVAEYAATWELQNPRDVGTLLRRTNYIYNEMVLSDERLVRLAADKLGCALSDITFAGLEYERYFAVLVGLYINVRNGVLNQKTSIIEVEELRRRAGFPPDAFNEFLAVMSNTMEDFRSATGTLQSLESFSAAVSDPAWCADMRLFRNRPLLRLPDGRLIVLDMQFLIENASAGLYRTLAAKFSERDRNLLLSYWGNLFEQYVQRLLGHYAQSSCNTNVEFSSGEADVIINAGGDVVVFEIKAGFIAQEMKGSRDRRALDTELRKKYVADQEGRPKGIGQLARTASELAKRQVQGVSHIYPVLVVEDPILQAFAVNSYLDQIFRTEMDPGPTVKPVTVLLVDELEEILPLIYSGHTSWQELFESRFINGSVVVEPMHTSLSYFARKRGLKRRQDTFLEPRTSELNRIIEEQYAALR